MNAIVPYTTAIVPLTGTQIEVAASNLQDFLKMVAQYQIREEVSDFEKRYTGAEQGAMIDLRALRLWDRMSYSFETTGANLTEDVKASAPFHPDLRTDPQEFIDELIEKTHQSHMGQAKYIVEVILPEAETLGMDVGNWLAHTTRYKVMELIPEFRFAIERRDSGELDAQRFNDVFRYYTNMSTRTITDIRKSKMPVPPENFGYEEEQLADGTFTWFINQLTETTKVWLSRRIQPYGHKIEVIDAD